MMKRVCSDDDFEFLSSSKKVTKAEVPPSSKYSSSLSSISIATPTYNIVRGADNDTYDRDTIEALEKVRNTTSSAFWIDPDFPPNQSSINGVIKEPAKPVTAESVKNKVPMCRCRVEAVQTVVKSETSNKGRPYYYCQSRRCGFFAWADGLKRSKFRRTLQWMRFDSQKYPIVSDYGFSATDLRQGGVGDCWFLSALAVVAERHDLIEKLFVDTSVNVNRDNKECFSIRLFLDGNWTSVFVDNFLPITDQPRRIELAFDTKLAFSRCGSEVGGQQLWVSLLEKAYAKAHGSYDAISGGEIHEALVDLTGCPSECLCFSDRRYDNIDMLWRKLKQFHEFKLPMGCATSSDPSLKEVGLCGNHAYSILEVKEVYLNLNGSIPSQFGDASSIVKLLRIRNPHGIGEWNGDWSDQSLKWFDCLSQFSHDQKPTGNNDGTFWMEFTQFLQGFSQVDVCYAYRDWHSKSFPNSFPLSQDRVWRLCSTAYLVQSIPNLSENREGDHTTALYISAIQPTKRGKWCRSDRKKSYRPGDLSIIIAKCNRATGSIISIVSSNFSGCEDRTTVFALLNNQRIKPMEEDMVYVVYLLCLGQPPSAAQQSKEQAFVTRFHSSQPLVIQSFQASMKAPNPVLLSTSSKFSASSFTHDLSINGIYSNPRTAFQTMFHLALLSSSDTSNILSQVSASSQSSFQSFDPYSTSSSLPPCYPSYDHHRSNTRLTYNCVMPEPPCVRRRFLKEGGKDCEVLVVQGCHALIFMVVNNSCPLPSSKPSSIPFSSEPSSTTKDGHTVFNVKLKIMVKSHIARDVNGLIANNQTAADEYYKSEELKKQVAFGDDKNKQSNRSQGGGLKWPAKWKAFETETTIHPQEQKVVMLVVSSGIQNEIGLIQCDICDSCDDSRNTTSSSSSSLNHQPSLLQFFKSERSSASSSSSSSSKPFHSKPSVEAGIFAPTSINEAIFLDARRTLSPYQASNSTFDLVDPAGNDHQEDDIDKAIENSLMEASIAASLKETDKVSHLADNDEELLQAMIESTKQQDRAGESLKLSEVVPMRDHIDNRIGMVIEKHEVIEVDDDDDEVVVLDQSVEVVCGTCTFNQSSRASTKSEWMCEICGSKNKYEVRRNQTIPLANHHEKITSFADNMRIVHNSPFDTSTYDKENNTDIGEIEVHGNGSVPMHQTSDSVLLSSEEKRMSCIEARLKKFDNSA